MPTKSTSPLLGYNNNVRHKGKVFHIQTEDSGIKYGHIITHLFMDGGRILKSVKTSYAEYVENDRMGEIVREMMKQQHKAMFIALRDGKFDSLIDGAEVSRSTQALQSAPSVHPVPGLRPPSVAAAKATPAPPQSAAASPASPPVRPAEATEAAVPPPTHRKNAEELTLVIEAVERATAAHATAPVLRPAADLPPPPANLFRAQPVTGKYRGSTAGPARSDATPAPSPSSGAAPVATRPIARAPAIAPPVERRYAPTRPASIFGQARPQQGKSIFGEDLLSDKSLDEVILSYLAEDLDADAKNKK
jgi:hypothetical protein